MSEELFEVSEEGFRAERVAVDPAQARRVTAALATRRLLLPLSEFGGALHVACAAVPDARLAESIRKQAGAERLVFHVGEAGAIRKELQRVYGGAAEGGAGPAGGGAEVGAEDAVGLAEELFRAARLRRASDVHIDPDRGGVEVRFRVDGRLERYRRLPPGALAGLVSRIKVMAGMDIAEKRAPQDGAFVLAAMPHDPRSAMDVRVATLPVKHGERVTLRLLSADRENLALERLGMSGEQLATVERVLDSPHGLMLLTGPTGSGKTTTLYAAIRRLAAMQAGNILTVEDPIEYEIPGVGQAEVDSADKVSFSKALRSLLRHDPDVIMIGEIRDAESLDTAVKASLTGHLVLSTLHTNDAPGAVTRLLDMGLAPHLLAATLRLAMAQRLVRKLCPVCRRPYTMGEEEAVMLGHPDLAGKTAWKPGGCLACAGKGTRGRTGIFELLAPDAELAGAIARGAGAAELEQSLAARGHRGLAEDAISKILDGTVTPGDVRREL